MKATFRLVSISLAATAISHAVTAVGTNTITSQNGLITVYEVTDNAPIGITANLGGGGSSFAPSSGDVYYFVDIVGDSNLSVVGIAVSFNEPSFFLGLNPSLGSQTSVLGLAAGVYDSSSWPTISSVPFATAFGPNDNWFIWIAGSIPISSANDVDGDGSLPFGDAHAWRSGSSFSEFVALGSGGSIISGSMVPEPSAALLLVTGACGIALRRRRIASRVH